MSLTTTHSSPFAPALLALAAASFLQNRVSAQAISSLEDYTIEEKLAELQSPNASAEVSIPDPSGFDLARPWPGATVDGWKFAIDIKADVPVREVDDLFATLTRIAYVPPSSVKDVVRNESGEFAPMDGTWYPCRHLWVSAVLAAGQDEDVAADCSTHLTEECLRDIRESTATGFLNWTEGSEEEEHCPPSKVPSTCEAQMLDPSEGNMQSLEDTFAKGLEGGPLDYFPLQHWLYDEKPPHESGDPSDYLRALQRVWVVGISWGYSNNSRFAQHSDVRINTTLACIRAKAITPIPENDPEGILDDYDGAGFGRTEQSLPVAVWSLATLLLALAFAVGL